MEMMINQRKRLSINNLFGVFVDGYGCRVRLMGYFYGLFMCGVGDCDGFSGCGFGCKCIIVWWCLMDIICYGLLINTNKYIVCIVWCSELGIYISVYILMIW